MTTSPKNRDSQYTQPLKGFLLKVPKQDAQSKGDIYNPIVDKTGQILTGRHGMETVKYFVNTGNGR